ncbi:hypothetical protein D9M69_220210 [compost metagenome]
MARSAVRRGLPGGDVLLQPAADLHRAGVPADLLRRVVSGQSAAAQEAGRQVRPRRGEPELPCRDPGRHGNPQGPGCRAELAAHLGKAPGPLRHLGIRVGTHSELDQPRDPDRQQAADGHPARRGRHAGHRWQPDGGRTDRVQHAFGPRQCADSQTVVLVAGIHANACLGQAAGRDHGCATRSHCNRRRQASAHRWSRYV